ncbi:hypothetical protein QMA0440_00032 [Yersinia ruckeri]|nr:hypothetical protein QMA0440_00032 [Yersinia ruckeri]
MPASHLLAGSLAVRHGKTESILTNLVYFFASAKRFAASFQLTTFQNALM